MEEMKANIVQDEYQDLYSFVKSVRSSYEISTPNNLKRYSQERCESNCCDDSSDDIGFLYIGLSY